MFKSSQNNEIEPKRTNLKEGEEDASKKDEEVLHS